MENHQGRKLPKWYLDKVNMAADVFRDNPDKADMSRPHVKNVDTGVGVTAQRRGKVAPVHRAYTPPATTTSSQQPPADVVGEWQRYQRAVSMAADVAKGAPQSVHRGMPIVTPDSGGQGVTVQRHGLMAREQTNVKLTGPKIGRRNGLRPPPPSTPLWQPPAATTSSIPTTDSEPDVVVPTDASATPATPPATSGDDSELQRYQLATSMAADVVDGAPQNVDTSRPHVPRRPAGGTGVSAQRQGKMANQHQQPPATPATPAAGGDDAGGEAADVVGELQRYRQAVDMAADVFSGNPQFVNTARPWLHSRAPGGQGINAQRIGKAASVHKADAADVVGTAADGDDAGGELQRYQQAVDMAADVVDGAPEHPQLTRPHVSPRPAGGQGVQSQRRGEVATNQPQPPATGGDDSELVVSELQRYQLATSMAYDAYDGSPQYVDKRRPHITTANGVAAQRRGKVAPVHRAYTPPAAAGGCPDRALVADDAADVVGELVVGEPPGTGTLVHMLPELMQRQLVKINPDDAATISATVGLIAGLLRHATWLSEAGSELYPQAGAKCHQLATRLAARLSEAGCNEYATIADYSTTL